MVAFLGLTLRHWRPVQYDMKIRPSVCVIHWLSASKQKQVVKVIWHKTASPPQTNGSIVFASMGRPFSPKNLPLPMGGSEPPSNTWSLGPTQVLNPNGISIGSAVFAGLSSVTDRQTDRQSDHATRSLTIDRIYVRSTAMRFNNYIVKHFHRLVAIPVFTK